MTVETKPLELTKPKQTEQSIPTRYVVFGIVGIVIVVGLIIALFVWLARSEDAGAIIEAIRDIFIIILALEVCLFGVVLIMMLLMMIRLVNMLEFEIKPILEKTNETVGMVRGTTAFVSQNVVKPVTAATSYIAGIRRGLSVLFGDPRKNLHD